MVYACHQAHANVIVLHLPGNVVLHSDQPLLVDLGAATRRALQVGALPANDLPALKSFTMKSALGEWAPLEHLKEFRNIFNILHKLGGKSRYYKV